MVVLGARMESLRAFLRRPRILLGMVVDEAEQHSHQFLGYRYAALLDQVPQLGVREAHAVVACAGSAEADLIGVEERRDSQSPLCASQLTGVVQAGQRLQNRLVPRVASHRLPGTLTEREDE